MTEQNTYTDSILPDQSTNMSKTNISKILRALHMMDFEIFHCKETSTPGMTVDVYGGRLFVGDAYAEFSLDGNKDVTTTASGTFTAPTTNPKIDLLYYDVSAGTLGITAGVEGASPAQPPMPGPREKISVALIYHRPGSTKILNSDDSTNSYIMGRNVRPFLNTHSYLKNYKKGADIASAPALTLGTDGNAFDVTGITGITSINSVGVGTEVLLRFDGIVTLTHHATDLDLGGSNITTVAGQILKFHEYASGDWRLVSNSASGVSGQIEVTDVTVTGSAASTPDANTLTKDHLIGAWCTYNGTGTPVFLNEVNMSGAIVDNGVGDHSWNIDRDFADGNFACVASPNTSQQQRAVPLNLAAGFIEVVCTDDTNTTTDIGRVSVICVGAQ